MRRHLFGILLVAGCIGAGASEAWAGRYSTVSVDGSLVDWQAGDVLYNDGEIGDGWPLNSTYSNIFVANDSNYLYVGLQLKAPSSINSNWTHEIFIDTDNNPATGFNSGWMSGGYDRLIQYGGGGFAYSVYSFVGGSQSDWAWNFIDTISYSFNQEIIEWAIWRGDLGGSTAPRMEFHVVNGDVSSYGVETWAMSFESGAKTYSMAPIPEYTLQVSSGRGTAVPAPGIYTNILGSILTNAVTAPTPANGTQYVALGWTMTGNEPATGSGTNFTMTATNNAALNWLWQTNVQFTRSAGANGSVSGPANGYYLRNSSVTVTAVANSGYSFAGWSGNVPAGQTNDSILTLTLDRTRSITANFRSFQGKFREIATDGSMGEWQAGDLFYQDFEIGDGAPLSSTYSNIYVANDQDYLYVGFQLKAPSSIQSNWLHSLYIDTDVNPATGFNAGWMNNGYDRLVQYGGSGGAYSIFTFTGGSQADWSWSFTDLIGYSFNGTTIEWAIPRTALGGSTQAKLEFYVGGGDVTIETWADQAEVNAKVYTFAATPNHTLQVISARGTPAPGVGMHTNAHGTVLTPTVTEPAAANGTQYVSLGWAMTGNNPATGSATNFSMTVTNNAVLTWQWQTNVQFTRTAGANGTVGGPANGYYLRNSSVTVTAAPNSGYRFGGWSGDVPAGQTNDNPLTLTLDRKRSITANFESFHGQFFTPTMDGALGEWSAGNLFYNDGEIGDGAPLNSTYSGIYVANDQTYLYVGFQLKAPSSILSNWLHSLYIDTDLNPATGFNAGWMNNGYDRLVQYGGGGGAYSIYTFAGGSQSDFSWNFADEIGYAYNGDVIEWAIPRSALGGSTSAKLEFYVGGGSVTIETWADQAEINAKVYSFAATPNKTLQVINARGTSQPAAGTYTNAFGSLVTNTVTEPAAANGTQYVSLGWAMTGNNPPTGSGTNFTMTVTNNAVLTWQWQTNVQFTRTAGANGTVGGPANGYYLRNSSVTVTAAPNGGYLFAGWSGDVPVGQTNDNPLTLTLDRKRAITANFGTHQGRYATMTMDANFSDWTAPDAFYVDSEITDGAPLNSTYSNVYVANDLVNLYIGLQLKAASSINSNWTHSLFIDSDLNPATGYNGGTLANGYDRLVQYGANGFVYSIYSFSGGSQSDWSWNFLGTFGYAFNGEFVEWSLPRSALGITGNAIKLEFLTEGGDVSIGTWAHQTEADARIYTLGSPPGQTLQIVSERGTPVPAVGTYTNAYGSILTNRVTSPAASGGTQYVSVGWTMTGNDPVSGGGTNFTMTLTNSAVLTWLWNTNVLFTRNASSGGSLSGDASGYYGLGAAVTVTASTAGGYIFSGWSGDVPGGQENDNPLTLTLDRARSITAVFSVDLGRYADITLDGDLGEWVAGDVFYNDSEIGDGLPLNSTYSSISVANDSDNLYVGLQLKAPSSINSNWTHEIYIDTDMNPATGFNSGWMSGGYDRLVQYGGGGGAYSVFSFTGGSQADWSWNFLGTIDYAYDAENIEWAIPRSFLGAGNAIRLEFHVVNGDVAVETWAAAAESDAKIYSFATPDNCVPGYKPVMLNPGNKTVHAGNLLSFTVSANDPGCIGPTLVMIGTPAGASFNASPSGTNQVGSFTWTPSSGDVGTYPVRFMATDDEDHSTSVVIQIYVGASGESTNSAGVPLSQTNWAVDIMGIDFVSSSSATTTWEAVDGIMYDVYVSSGPFESGMSWTKVQSAIEADASLEETVVNLSGFSNFIQIRPLGVAPSTHGVWGVIKPSIPFGISYQSPPLSTDRHFDGDMGAALAAALPQNTLIYVMAAGSNPSWTTLRRDGSGNWVIDGGSTIYTTPLDPGQGFLVQNPSGTALPEFVGPVGNDGTSQITLQSGFNIIGISEGKSLAASSAFESASPVGSYDEAAADQVIFLNPNGSWRRLIRRPTGIWYDTANPNSSANTSQILSPGQGYYYIRVGGGTALDF